MLGLQSAATAGATDDVDPGKAPAPRPLNFDSSDMSCAEPVPPASAVTSSDDIDSLIQANGQLLAQAANHQLKVEASRKDALEAVGQVQLMRQLVKSQHAKREETAAVLQAEIDDLKQECRDKESQVRLFATG